MFQQIVGTFHVTDRMLYDIINLFGRNVGLESLSKLITIQKLTRLYVCNGFHFIINDRHWLYMKQPTQSEAKIY